MRSVHVSLVVTAAAPPTAQQQADLLAAVEAQTGGLPIKNFKVTATLVSARRLAAPPHAGPHTSNGGGGTRRLAVYDWVTTFDVVADKGSAAAASASVSANLVSPAFTSQVSSSTGAAVDTASVTTVVATRHPSSLPTMGPTPQPTLEPAPRPTAVPVAADAKPPGPVIASLWLYAAGVAAAAALLGGCVWCVRRGAGTPKDSAAAAAANRISSTSSGAPMTMSPPFGGDKIGNGGMLRAPSRDSLGSLDGAMIEMSAVRPSVAALAPVVAPPGVDDCEAFLADIHMASVLPRIKAAVGAGSGSRDLTLAALCDESVVSNVMLAGLGCNKYQVAAFRSAANAAIAEGTVAAAMQKRAVGEASARAFLDGDDDRPSEATTTVMAFAAPSAPLATTTTTATTITAIATTATTTSAAASTAVAAESRLPVGWTEHKDAAGRSYYFSIATNQTSWIRPGSAQAPATPEAEDATEI